MRIFSLSSLFIVKLAIKGSQPPSQPAFLSHVGWKIGRVWLLMDTAQWSVGLCSGGVAAVGNLLGVIVGVRGVREMVLFGFKKKRDKERG